MSRYSGSAADLREAGLPTNLRELRERKRSDANRRNAKYSASRVALVAQRLEAQDNLASRVRKARASK